MPSGMLEDSSIQYNIAGYRCKTLIQTLGIHAHAVLCHTTLPITATLSIEARGKVFEVLQSMIDGSILASVWIRRIGRNRLLLGRKSRLVGNKRGRILCVFVTHARSKCVGIIFITNEPPIGSAAPIRTGVRPADFLRTRMTS